MWDFSEALLGLDHPNAAQHFPIDGRLGVHSRPRNQRDNPHLFRRTILPNRAFPHSLHAGTKHPNFLQMEVYEN